MRVVLFGLMCWSLVGCYRPALAPRDTGNTDVEATCNGQDQVACDDSGYWDGFNGSSPDAASQGCTGGCRQFYCDAYCEGEVDAYGELIDCNDC